MSRHDAQERSMATPGIEIRATRPDDAAGLAALHDLPGFRFGTLQLPFRTEADVRRRLDGPGLALSLVAVAGGELVGNAGLERFEERRAHAGAIGMGVHDSWAGRGIGTRLLGALVEHADRWLGLRRLELTVYSDNAAALALYRRFGFAVEGTLCAYALRDGVLVDAHAMARIVPPPLQQAAAR
jgi:putative acetyltransferase